MMTAELQKLRTEEPVFAIALYGGQTGLDVTPDLAFGLTSDRERLFSASHPDGWAEVWDPYEYGDGDFVEPALAEPPAPVLKAWHTLRERLDGNVVNPTTGTLARVARKLNAAALPLTMTDDGMV